MVYSLKHTIRALAIIPLMLFLFSCASYNRQIGNYYSQVVSNDYAKANESIDHIKKLQSGRNRLLYLLEKGKMAHLLKEYESSNRYFNEADLFMDDARTSVKDVALGTLLNPMMRTYKGEDFEKFMVHYYKALNYLYLGKTDDALVEARRISLETYSLEEKSKGYRQDAFSQMLQGIIYEQGGDVNNAFIAYRNAADVFLENNNCWYGVSFPDQLKKDVLRTADMNGFSDELERYKKLFDLDYERPERPEGGELVLFWENGLAPVKREQNLFFSLTKNGVGNFVFTDARGVLNIPLYFNDDLDSNDLNLKDLRSFRVAFPAYEEQALFYNNAVVNVRDSSFLLEGAQNINTLAFETLKERFVKEMSLALSRLVVKKLAEEAVRPKKDDKKKTEKETIAFALQVFNFASEKADTRNWQSLPHTIFYTRVPLQKGTNTVSLQLNSGSQNPETLELTVEGTGDIQVKNICTLK